MVNKRISYSAVTSSKEIVNGIFDGNKREFEEFIRQKKLIVTSFKEIKKKLKKGKLTQDDFLALIEELYYLINSGMSIDKAIKLLITTSAKEAQIKILVHILEDIKGGTQLSLALKSSLEKEKFNVDALSIGFIATSEEVGNLSDGLLQLFEYLTFQKVIRGDIKQALAYPMFLMGMAVVVSFLIFFLIIPKFSTIFSPEEFERLPSLSYAILSLGNYLNDNGAMVFSIIIAIVSSFIIFIKRVGINWLSIFYHTPKLRDLVIDIQLSIVYGALGTMLKGGLELDRALRQLQKIKLLKEINDLLKNTLTELKRGIKMSEVFSLNALIPPSDIALLYVGESSASMPQILASLSKRHSDAFSRDVKKVLSILEPAVIVLLGIFIAVIIVAIMMAVMSISDITG